MTFDGAEVVANADGGVAGYHAVQVGFAGAVVDGQNVRGKGQVVILGSENVFGGEGEFATVIFYDFARDNDVAVVFGFEAEGAVAIDLFAHLEVDVFANARFEGAVDEGAELNGARAGGFARKWAHTIASASDEEASGKGYEEQAHITFDAV